MKKQKASFDPSGFPYTFGTVDELNHALRKHNNPSSKEQEPVDESWWNAKMESECKSEKMYKITKWLYLNDRTFESKYEWREEFIKFLESVL